MDDPASLPTNWTECALAELGVWSGGGTPSKANPAFWTDGTVPWVSPKDMKTDRIRSAADHITTEAVAKSSAKLIPANSVLMVTRSGILAHSFPVAVTECEVAVNQDLKSLTPHQEVDADYIAWLLRGCALRVLKDCAKHGTTVASVDSLRLKNFLVPLPSPNEQKRIVEKIDTLFARLDKGEAAVQAVQKLLTRYRRSILKAAFTGELTADWRAQRTGQLEHGRDLLARILETRRKSWQGRGKYKRAPEPKVDHHPQLPEEWVWASLAQTTILQGGVTVDRNREAKDPVTHPYLRVANVQNGYLDLREIKEITVEREQADKCLLVDGDILFNEGGDLDKLGRGWVWHNEVKTCIHQNHVFRGRPVVAELSSEFVSYYANAFGQGFFMDKGKQSVNLASISLTAISSLPVPLPSFEEQAEIAEQVGAKMLEINTLRGWCETELKRSASLRQSILKDAFAGRLVPQDPSDEPASALLARIMAEKAKASPARRKTRA